MFKAFGLDNKRSAPEWSGTLASQEADTASDDDSPASAAEEQKADPAAVKKASSAGSQEAMSEGRAPPGSPPAAAPARRRSAEAQDSFDFGIAGAAAPAPEAARNPARPASPVPPPASKPKALESEPGWSTPPELPRELPARRLIPMRRVYDRIGAIDAPPRLLDSARPARLAQLEARASAQELNRGALKELYAADFLAGELELASQVAERWSEKDPLDPDALTARADLAAQRGQRERAIRILGSVVDVRPGDYKSQWRLARLHRWSGDPARGCRHSLAVAQLQLRDAKLVAEALRCAREVGQKGWVEDLIAALSPDVRQRALSLEEKPRPSDELSGDLRVQATWQGAEHDLDLVILHPEGYRVSWLGAPTRAVISATDVLSVHREGLALRGAEAGQYAIEVVRSSATSGPVRGSLSLQVGKAQRTLPFVLEGERLRVATARIRLESRLVPVEGW
jgi:tetratricopeptide (TPR) repeat protein